MRPLWALPRLGSIAQDVVGLRRWILALAISGQLDDDVTDADQTGAGEFRPLSTVAHLKKGLTPIKQAVAGAYPFVVTAEARSSCDHYDFEGPAAIIPLVSSTGHGNASIKRLHYQEGRFAVGTILCAVFPREPERLSARFLYEYLSAFKEELLVSRMVGTANVTLTLAKIAEVPIPLIPRAAMRRLDKLMALCDELDAAQIAREERRDRLRTTALQNLVRNDESEDDALSLLQHCPRMLTKPEHVAAVRRAILDLGVRGRLVPQACTPVPSSRLGDVCSQVTDGTHKTPTYVAAGVPFISTKDFSGGRLNFASTRFIPAEEHAQLIKRCKPELGDVLLGRIGTLGKPVVVDVDREFSLFVSVGLLKPRRDLISSEYLWLFLASPMAETEYDRIKVGGGTHTNKLNLGDLKTISLPVPELAQQYRIVAKVAELMAVCDELEQTLATTQNERARLLQALLRDALKDREPARSGDRDFLSSSDSGQPSAEG